MSQPTVAYVGNAAAGMLLSDLETLPVLSTTGTTTMFDESFIDELATKVADKLATRQTLVPDTPTELDPNLEATLAAEVEIAASHDDADVAIAEAYAEAESDAAESDADTAEAVAEVIAEAITPDPPEPVIVTAPVEDDETINDVIEDFLPGDPEDSVVPDIAPMPDVAPKASHWFQRPLR